MTANSYNELNVHVGHKVQVSNYAEQNVSIECVTCSVVLADYESLACELHPNSSDRLCRACDNETCQKCDVCDWCGYKQLYIKGTPLTLRGERLVTYGLATLFLLVLGLVGGFIQ